MIPIKLKLKNFLCYGENVPTLDFQGMHLACLWGQNGHGKTAILEAITWSLWGKGRCKTQPEFVRIGQKSMSVELDFQCRNEAYRVSRTFSKSRGSGPGKTNLEIQMINTSSLIPITDNTTGETQKKINGILNMDYETFINTAFLKQGEADSFATSKASERKQILANILSLSSYNSYAVGAKELSSRFDSSIEGSKVAIATKHQEVESLGTPDITLLEITTRLAELSAIVEKETSGKDRINKIESLNSFVNEAQQKQELLMPELPQYKLRIEAKQEIVAKADEINNGFQELTNLRNAFKVYGELQGKHHELEQRKTIVSKSISDIKANLSAEFVHLGHNIDSVLKPQAKKLSEIKDLLLTANESYAKLVLSQQQTLKKKQTEKETAVGRINALLENNHRLKDDIKDIHNKFLMLESDKATCPLCDRELDHRSHDNLKAEYEQNGKTKQEQLRHNKALITNLDKEKDLLSKQIIATETSNKTAITEMQNKIADLTARENLSLQATEKMLSENERHIELETMLEKEIYAESDFLLLKSIEQQLSAIKFDPVKYQLINTQITELSKFDSLHKELVSSKESLKSERDSFDRIKASIDLIKDDIISWEKEKSCLVNELSQLYQEKPSEIVLPNIENRLQTASKEQQQALIQKAIVQENIKKIQELSNDIGFMVKDIKIMTNNKNIYDELSAAFGKNGVQALLIEQALPLLQDESNELLNRLTEGRLSIKFQLMQGKKGANWKLGIPSEELEILISDESGTRSYETYSGGESFRINFAVRIALSKLLANRSGAPLPILFIDEGFGSQDRTGQELLIEIIQNIKSDFEKILVVTHIDEIKEAFPTRIEVEKTYQGSSFTIV